MSVECYTYRPGATPPGRKQGPLLETDVDRWEYGLGVELTDQDYLAHGWCSGPRWSNANALLVLRSLGLEVQNDLPCLSIAADELHGRLLLALAVGGCFSDDGHRAAVSRQPGRATVIDCGVPAGYLAQAYREMLTVVEQARVWQTDVVFA